MRLVITVGLALATASGALAQQSLLEAETRRAGSRNRERMHPGNALVVVGSEQEDNSFRNLTPSLMHAEKVAVLVDPEENYRRRLAMYESRQRFDSALTARSWVYSRDLGRTAPRHEVVKGEGPAPDEPDSGNKALLAGMGMVAGLIALIRKLSS